jgi:hypothetical protein
MKRLVLLILACSLALRAEERARLWKWSVVTLAAATAADMHSSYGMQERNPLLRGSGRRFDANSALLKAGAVGVFLVGQKLFLPGRSGRKKNWAVVNFSAAATTSVFAAHNYVIRYK